MTNVPKVISTLAQKRSTEQMSSDLIKKALKAAYARIWRNRNREKNRAYMRTYIAQYRQTNPRKDK